MERRSFWDGMAVGSACLILAGCRARAEPTRTWRVALFASERGSPFTMAGFARIVECAGEAAKLGFKADLEAAHSGTAS
jgi:hypothetical protein